MTVSNKKNSFLFIVICIFFCFAKAQNNDSMDLKKSDKRNIIYIMPTSIGGDMYWDLENFWLEFGYARKFIRVRQNYVDLKFGVIVYSSPTYAGGFFSSINSLKTKGFNLNIEHRIILIKKFYYSTNIFYQNTRTIRNGEYNRDRYTYVSDNNYTVIRNVYCLQPKIGFQFIKQKNNIYADVGLGIGIRYIQSHTINKINTDINSGYETFANKEFDRGSKFAQRISFQIKVGYNF